MPGKISAERLYSLGNYKNIKFIEEVNDIPDDLMFNVEYVTYVRTLQALRLDKSYLQYLQLFDEVVQKVIDETMELAEAISTLDVTAKVMTDTMKEFLNRNLKSIIQKE